MKAFGVASKTYLSAEEAKGDTYTKNDGSFPPTNLFCKENPYKKEAQQAQYILDFGCGVGRNMPWVMMNTNAVYVGLDPNETMLYHFWNVQEENGFSKEEWGDRVILCKDFSQISEGVKFDYIISTFVLQHLGYRYNNEFNLNNIAQAVFTYSNKGAIWFALEHDSEEDWIPRWTIENNINLEVYIRGYKGLPELTDRDNTAPNGGHHLMIFKI